MDAFSLSASLVREYEAFSRSFVAIRSEDIRKKVNEGYGSRRFWPSPLLQINPHYKSGGRLSGLVGDPGLCAETARIFRAPGPALDHPDPSLHLHRHQAQAIEIALSGKSYVVTTGTGSGKSLCFFIPIVDAILKAKRCDPTARTRAIVVYPMNALANSQREELKKFLGDDGAVQFARYTGQETRDDREKIRDRAPDILLTNFMMLELLMTRQNDLDRKVLENCRGLKFIVLDELHTYRGRQGADVALLMRRLKARVCAPEQPPVAIGTSATMSSAEDEYERKRAVADVASRIFGTRIGIDAVITESLQRATDATRSAGRNLEGLAEAVWRAAEPGALQGRTNARIRRINRGLRRRRDEAEVGFLINPRTGRWLGRSAGEGNEPAPADQPQRITPVVEDHKNALMIRFPAALRGEAGDDADAFMVTLQHALARGIEANFQLEEGEILGEPTPSRTDRNALLFYEAAEGGAGALGRLVREIEQFQAVARGALTAIHLTDRSIEAAASGPGALADETGTRCVAGCYQCLLSYYNQPDHADIDRRLPILRSFLLRLLAARFAAPDESAGPPPHGEGDGLPPPDAEPLRFDGVELPMVWRRHRIVAVEAGSPAAGLAAELEDRGLWVVVLPAERAARAAGLEGLARRLRDAG